MAHVTVDTLTVETIEEFAILMLNPSERIWADEYLWIAIELDREIKKRQGVFSLPAAVGRTRPDPSARPGKQGTGATPCNPGPQDAIAGRPSSRRAARTHRNPGSGPCGLAGLQRAG